MPEILLVDDSPGDTDLVRHALAGKLGCRVHAVVDGEEAIAFLRRAGKHSNAVRPGLMMLDLNLPRKTGHEVLNEVKTDPNLRQIPVVIFTTSRSHLEVARSYDLGANCHVSKPPNLAGFFAAVQSIESFWFDCVCLSSTEKL
jgi:CheY-like chemotaxis protein